MKVRHGFLHLGRFSSRGGGTTGREVGRRGRRGLSSPRVFSYSDFAFVSKVKNSICLTSATRLFFFRSRTLLPWVRQAMSLFKKGGIFGKIASQEGTPLLQGSLHSRGKVAGPMIWPDSIRD